MITGASIAAGEHLSRECQIGKLENDMAGVVFCHELHHRENLVLKPRSGFDDDRARVSVVSFQNAFPGVLVWTAHFLLELQMEDAAAAIHETEHEGPSTE